MSTLLLTDPRFADHVAAPGHPERPERLEAVLSGAVHADVADALVQLEPRPASAELIRAVHPDPHLDRLRGFSEGGGGAMDADTGGNEASYDVAVLAAGAGPTAIEALDAGDAVGAFCAVRPPGHHATPDRAMGFCFINNVAVAARMLTARGERVLIVDYDAHHGNGTQDVFFSDPGVVYVSLHQYPLYPGTGRIEDIGRGEAAGTTVNVPFPAGTTGDRYRSAFDHVIAPVAADFDPTWLLISAGFDAHRADPLTGLGLSSGDFADLTTELLALVPAGRRLVFLEGGYDLDALRDSAAACLGAMNGVRVHPEPPTSGGPGQDVVTAVAALHRRLRDEADRPTPASSPSAGRTIATGGRSA